MEEMNEQINTLKDKRDIVTLTRLLAGLLIIIGTVVFLTFLFKTCNSHHIPMKGEAPNLAESGQFGDFIGGLVGTIFSLVGVLLLYRTLQEQRDNFHRERMESNYYEMIKFHRENVNELFFSYNTKRYKISDLDVEIIEHKFEKRAVFKSIYDQFSEAHDELAYLFQDKKPEDVYDPGYLAKLQKNSCLIERKIDLIQYAKIDIIYSIIFFGLGHEGYLVIKKLLADKYSASFLKDILLIASMKPKKESSNWGKWEIIVTSENSDSILREINHKWRLSIPPADNTSNTNQFNIPTHTVYNNPSKSNLYYDENYNKYYGGHQFRLGHYFRHLYQSVTYIDNQKMLEYQEKYGYIKTLRGQLSTYEQVILFINSLSTIGRVWEFENKRSPELSISFNKQLITKYNLIKNIPSDLLLEDIKISSYYPYIEYEAFHSEKALEGRKQLESKYW